MSFPKKQLIVLHKSGANSHYKGLHILAVNNGYEVVYREFSVLSRMIKSIVKLEGKLFTKQIKNLWTLLQLLFTKNKKVILGIAPYDKTLLRLQKVLSGHQIYYHTSWPTWDGNHYPKKKGVTKKVKYVWKRFLENEVEQVFTVTKTAKENMEAFYDLKNSAQVVGHSFSKKDFFINTSRKGRKLLTFCYVGRLVEQKGIIELLNFFKSVDTFVLHITGDGPLRNQVEKVAQSYQNIIYQPATSDKSLINKLFNESDYLLLNSKKTEKWQELFGMVIIEAMAAGCIPVATNHVGPKEIIVHEENGYLFEEDAFIDQLKHLLTMEPSSQIREKALLCSQDYEVHQVANYWKPVLKNLI